MMKIRIVGLGVVFLLFSAVNICAAPPVKCSIDDDCPGTFCEPGICVSSKCSVGTDPCAANEICDDVQDRLECSVIGPVLSLKQAQRYGARLLSKRADELRMMLAAR